MEHIRCMMYAFPILLQEKIDPSMISKYLSLPRRRPRAYPRALGDAIFEAYLEHLRGPATGDLRVKRTPSKTKTPVELFEGMALGDVWEEANLKVCFDYLYKCKHVRTGFLTKA